MTQDNAICIKWGTAYVPDYVNRLHSGIPRNLSVPVRFFCMTKIRQGMHLDIEVLELPDEPWLDQINAAQAKYDFYQMRKVSLFRPGQIPDLDEPFRGSIWTWRSRDRSIRCRQSFPAR